MERSLRVARWGLGAGSVYGRANLKEPVIIFLLLLFLLLFNSLSVLFKKKVKQTNLKYCTVVRPAYFQSTTGSLFFIL